MDKVFIKNMEVVCIVGILDFERTTKQRLLVNIEVDTDLKKCSKSGDLTDSIDYARMAHLVRDYIINKQAFLLSKNRQATVYQRFDCPKIFANLLRFFR